MNKSNKSRNPSGSATTRPETGKRGHANFSFSKVSTISKPRPKSKNSVFSADKTRRMINRDQSFAAEFIKKHDPDVNPYNKSNSISNFLDKGKEATKKLKSEKSLRLSKNSDKLVRESSFKIMPDDLRGMENMLHQTNNLLLYKSRMKSMLNVDEFRKDTNTYLLQIKNMNSKIKIFDKIHEIDNREKLNQKLEVKLYDEIDHMIDKLGKK